MRATHLCISVVCALLITVPASTIAGSDTGWYQHKGNFFLEIEEHGVTVGICTITFDAITRTLRISSQRITEEHHVDRREFVAVRSAAGDTYKHQANSHLKSKLVEMCPQLSATLRELRVNIRAAD